MFEEMINDYIEKIGGRMYVESCYLARLSGMMRRNRVMRIYL